MAESLAEKLLWLCRIPSPIGEERALCDAVAERLGKVRTAGPIRRYGDSLVVPLKRGSGGPHVTLAGHLDVVRTEHDGPPRIEGERLYAAGAADMKSGVCLMLDLAERTRLPNVDLTLVFYAREEGPFAENELGRVLDEDPDVTRSDVAIALEPSDNKLQLGCGGSLHATVAFLGRTAHSARPWQGENAIHKAAGLLGRLSALAPETDVVDGLEWKSVISATLGSGGRARNVIPDRFELNLNHRFGPGTSVERAKARVEALVAGDAEVDYVDVAPSAPPRRDHPLIAALAECGVAGLEPKQAWTDVARFSAAGVPAANFGPGTQAQAHQKNEWTLVAGLDTGKTILDRWLGRIGGTVATLALVAGVVATGSLATGCAEGAPPSAGRSDAVEELEHPGPPLFERPALERFLGELGRRVGADARALAVDVREHGAVVQVEDGAQPGRIVEHELAKGAFGEPRTAEVRGRGKLDVNLFALSSVALGRIPELVTRATTEIDAAEGRVTRVLVRRHLPKTDAVRFRVYVESPRLSGFVDFDHGGNPVPQAL
ncbi:MAG TPA: succinyl-diaminopimelate desuccinylase [Polyangiaceae bacterium]